MNTITDHFQQPLSVGDRIHYPVSTGSSGVRLAHAIIDLIEELVPKDPSDPTCRYGYKYSDRHKPPMARTELQILGRWVQYPNGIAGTDYRGNPTMLQGRWEYDPTKLFKLRIKGQTYDGSFGDKTSWITNVDRVVRSPEAVQS